MPSGVKEGERQPSPQDTDGPDFPESGRSRFHRSTTSVLHTLGRTRTCVNVAHCDSLREVDVAITDTCKQNPDNHLLEKTLLACVRLLAKGIGGVILAVVHDNILDSEEIRASSLDQGRLFSVWEEVARSIHDDSEAFEEMLLSFTAHNSSDRWEQHELEALAMKLPQVAKVADNLKGCAKDGAILLSHKGHVKGVALHLQYASEQWVLVRRGEEASGKKDNEKSCGTRHASAMGFAEWLGEIDAPSGVFVRSDGGGAHAFLPQGPDKEPKVCLFKTKEHPTNEQMRQIFRDKIESRGRLMIKAELGLARQGSLGEHVKTVVGNRVTSDVVIKDTTSMVVRAPTSDQENYVLPKAKFEKSWLTPGIDLNPRELTGDGPQDLFMRSQARLLRQKGYRLYRPNPEMLRWVYTLTREDVETHLSTGYFFASWGALQPVQVGDSLALPHPAGDEVYLYPPEALTSLEEVDVNTRQKVFKNRRHLLQPEMVAVFKPRMREFGKVMRSKEPVLIRPGIIGERIVTCINGRSVYDTMVDNPNTHVVRSSGEDHELYCIDQRKFEELYVQAGVPLEPKCDDPVRELLKQQGFKEYTVRPHQLKLVYQLKPEDMEDLPSGYFETAWGALQHVESGDHIAMRYVAADPSAAEDPGRRPKTALLDIYFMPTDVLGMHEEVGGFKHPRDFVLSI